MSYIPTGGKPSLMEMMKAAAEAHQAMRLPKPADFVSSAVPEAIPRINKRRTTLPMWNNSGAPAPELVLMKRVAPPQEATMSDRFSDLLKAATTALEDGRISDAEYYVDAAERIQKQQEVHHYHYYSSNGKDDDDDEQTDEEMETNFKSPSNPSKTRKAASNNNSSDDDDDDDDDEDPNYTRKIYKAAADYNLPHYGATPSPTQPTSTVTGAPQRADTYQLSVTPTVGQPTRTAFEDYVDKIVERDKCSRLIAQQKARVEQPASYAAFQQFTSDEPTSAQAMRRDRGMTTKAAPFTWEDHIAAELRGCTEEIAAVRALQKHGSFALQHSMIQKRGPSVARQFSKRAAEILEMGDADSRCEALRKLRLERPDLYRALNES
jgi:hypothetical protein